MAKEEEESRKKKIRRKINRRGKKNLGTRKRSWEESRRKKVGRSEKEDEVNKRKIILKIDGNKKNERELQQRESGRVEKYEGIRTGKRRIRRMFFLWTCSFFCQHFDYSFNKCAHEKETLQQLIQIS